MAIGVRLAAAPAARRWTIIAEPATPAPIGTPVNPPQSVPFEKPYAAAAAVIGSPSKANIAQSPAMGSDHAKTVLVAMPTSDAGSRSA